MRTQLVLGTAALTLALGACGGGTAGTSPTLPSLSEEPTAGATTTTTTEAVDPDEAWAEYDQCMRDQGVEMPDLESTGTDEPIAIEDSNFDFEAWEEAEAKCGPLLEAAFGEFELTPEQQAELADQELAFAKCMRDRGIDWPDPDPSGNGVVEIQLNGDPEEMNAALETCTEEVWGNEAGGGFIVEHEVGVDGETS